MLEGKRLIVTGGFGALGSEVARSAALAGARVVAIDRQKAEQAPRIDGVFGIGEVDLSRPEEAERAVAAGVEWLGGLDGLVNVVGAFRWEPLESGSVETWDFLYNVNLRTAVVTTKAALPRLQHEGGRIVNISAATALRAGAGIGAYAASKAGVIKLTEALAEELKERGVTVNAVLPSIIDTPANRAEMKDADTTRWVRPGDLAAVILFLLSDAAVAVTGAAIPVVGRT